MRVYKRFGCLAVLAGIVLALANRPANAQPEHSAPVAGQEEVPHETGGEKANLLSFQPDLAIFSALVFLALLWVLSKYAWPHISAALDERERKIEGHMAAAAAKHEEAKQLLAAHEARLAAAAGEVRALLEEARRDADHTRKRIETEGHQAAKDELDRAIREIDRAKNGAIEELSKSTANVAIDLARHIVGDRITSDQQASIVREAMGKLAAASPSKN
jgi:F-type H+-transporting ATPase subunit b